VPCKSTQSSRAEADGEARKGRSLTGGAGPATTEADEAREKLNPPASAVIAPPLLESDPARRTRLRGRRPTGRRECW
jgi:hypothetical protein